jgi:hypothetical protein
MQKVSQHHIKILLGSNFCFRQAEVLTGVTVQTFISALVHLRCKLKLHFLYFSLFGLQLNYAAPQKMVRLTVKEAAPPATLSHS